MKQYGLFNAALRVLTPGLCFACALAIAKAQIQGAATIQINADRPGVRISSNLFGIFFEEINCAGDGGLYAELVRNRSFEEPNHTDYWQLATMGGGTGQIIADSTFPMSVSNRWSLRLTQTSSGGSVGAANGGFWGMNLQAGRTYHLSCYARASNQFAGTLTVRLENANGSQVLAQTSLTGLTTNWSRFTAMLIPISTSVSGRLVIAVSQPGTLWLDVVSLFPEETFFGRSNGLRSDLGNLLDELNPTFVRFPGGCWVEGEWMTNSYRWKATIGDPANRATKWNLWQYYSNNGLGYHEYLQLCEDLGAAPLFVINCGMAHQETVPLANMGEYVQDALDAIEYANGPPTSTWGALRAANGHPAPFNLKFIEIGNENGGTAYNERYALFYDAIKANYPDIKIISCVWGGTPTSRPLEIIDEHYYNNPAFFINNASRYDTYNRSGPKIYVGEYAVTSGNGNGNLRGALAEAAFMTGMERNSDIVLLSSYAPLFANLNHKSWNPDLIYFDSSRVAPTPSYHVQKLFAQNVGDVVLPVAVSASIPVETDQTRHGAIGLGAWNTGVEYTNVVVTKGGQTLFQSDFGSGAAGWRVYRGTWSTANGLYQQTAITTDCRSTAGDVAWSDYTLTLRARKTGGSEGFLILFNWLDDDDWTWWNIGGWNNTGHGIEHCQNGSKSVLGTSVTGQVELNRWYEIRIELSAGRIRCYLDGALIHDVNYPAPKQGAIGLGTWSTRASYTNVVVTKAGQTFYQSDFTAGAPGWTVFQGTWSTANGVYRQTSTSTDCRATTGDTNWTDYTLTLRARKDSGSEGFLILFHWLDNNNWTWWNIGGWGNTRHAIEVCEDGSKSMLGSSVNGSVETNRWYDIRIELSGSRMRCYLDNTLIHDVNYPNGISTPLHASASFADASGQIVLKAVNVADVPIATTFDLSSVPAVASQATVTLLTSSAVTDENTLDVPNRVAPVVGTITNVGTNFSHTFPANSLTVFRFQTPPTLPVRVSLVADTNQNNMAAFAGGIPVRLSSFITNRVWVSYVVQAADGTILANGTLEFVPGQVQGFISLPPSGQIGSFLRVTLSNPINAILGGVTTAYFAAPFVSGEALRLNWARFPDETLLFWTDSGAQLDQAGHANGSWSMVTNSQSPFRIEFEAPIRFYRLRR